MVFSLELCVEGHSDAVLYRIPKGSTLRFIQSGKLAALGGVVDLQFNQAESPSVKFDRKHFTCINDGDENQMSTVICQGDWKVDIELHTAGSYEYRFTHRETTDIDSDLATQSGYIVVEPELKLVDGTCLSLDALVVQTVMAPMLGHLSMWRERLQVAKESGYNMIHFSPIQQLGSSQSAYSISEQLMLLNETRYLPLEPGERPSQHVTQSSVGHLSAAMLIDVGFTDVYKVIKDVHRDWGIFSMVDVVWNHTAADSTWLRDHPEAGYNLKNSPHLKPAYELDRALKMFSREVARGERAEDGISGYIHNEDDIRQIAKVLRGVLLSDTVLWEYFSVNTKEQVELFAKHVENKVVEVPEDEPEKPAITIVQDPQYGRCSCTIDMAVAEDLLFHRSMNGASLAEHIERAKKDLEDTLDWLNGQQQVRIEQDIFAEVIHNCMANVRFEYLEYHGPRREKVTVDHDLVPSYFFHLDGDILLAEDDVQDAEKAERVLSHNGWVINADPLANFASADSQVYLRRHLIPWGDSCKLRYGQSPDDSPWLWQHMTNYTRQMARIFHGFRIDNCHNTPMHVAEYLLDEARLVRPELYVVAELFTDSEAIDNIFINHLGINSLIREASSAYNSKELGRLVHRFGGAPVGSLAFDVVSSVQPLRPCMAHALLFDMTHDNEALLNTRSAYDSIASSALVSMACCGSGSSRGYDELVPYKIGVVGGERVYTIWDETGKTPPPAGFVNMDCGILAAKRALNTLHRRLSAEGFEQVYVDQVSDAVVTVTRQNPRTHESVILVAHTAFQKIPEHQQPREDFMGVSGYIPPLAIHGVFDEIVMECRLLQRTYSPMQNMPSDPNIIVGLPDFRVDMQEHVSVDASYFCELRETDNGQQEVNFHHFPPGAVIVLKTSLGSRAKQAVDALRGYIFQYETGHLDLANAISRLSLIDMNRVLYRCDAEEQDDGNGSGAYVVPRSGPLVYCGLQGVVSLMRKVAKTNDLGHGLCDNLRSGNWLIDYSVNRLRHHHSLREFADALAEVFAPLNELPRYLVPAYFHQILQPVHRLLLAQTFKSMGPFIQDGSEFVKGLALGSVQLFGVINSSPMPVTPSSGVNGISGDDAREAQPVATMAAGLPHFATGFMRCWGRDTFIALRGLLMVTGRMQEAKSVILAFAACVRHGLIPNLLGGGTGARYNCRDAPWWFLQAIQDYTTMTGGDQPAAILDERVQLIFNDDDAAPNVTPHKVVTLRDVIQMIMERHALGIEFRERGAGPDIDMNMSHAGFDVCAGIDWKTGFPYGGSINNCGTWMDKVGESDRAKNRGVPATPRDGSAVEIVALCKSAVSWLSRLSQAGLFTSNVPTNHPDMGMTYGRWARLIQEHFEWRFWVPLLDDDDDDREGDNARFIHRRGIYKDTVGASKCFADFQLRPNYPIAMVVAPELFTPERAAIALENVHTILDGPLGLATLDPKDWAYNGIYDNGVDSEDAGSARGFNYHQGPEWLWIKGCYLRARLRFASQSPSPDSVVADINTSLSRLQEALMNSTWQGLPELTNANGADCKDSCPVQAWSMSCLLDLMHDLSRTDLDSIAER